MRRWVGLAAGVLLLATGASARAQNRGPIFFFGGVDPTNLTFQPVNTASASVVPIAQPETRSFSSKLIDLLPKIPFPGAKPVIGQSQFPTEDQMPGANYLRAFHIRMARPVGN
jgi:hypothetical protein